jgi:hypothetical protein
MSNKKFNLAKVGWLILLCFGIIVLGANHSQAMEMPVPLAVDSILFGGPDGGTGFYTKYWLDTEMYGVLDAFCVEDYGLDATKGYELVNVEDYIYEIPADLGTAAIIANLYYNGTIGALPAINADEAKTAAQLAIWDVLGIFDYLGSYPVTEPGPYTAQVQAILEAIEGLDSSDIPSTIYLAESPADGHYGHSLGKSQDYLVSVPDADIMWLLGTAFIVLGVLGRKKSYEQL